MSASCVVEARVDSAASARCLERLQMDVHELIGRMFREGGGEGARFVVLGSGRRLRWILPAGRPKIDHLLRSWRPYGRLSRLGWRAVSECARRGMLGILPGARIIQADISGTSWHAF